MIVSLRSDHKEFKEVRFDPTFNVIVADIDERSTEKDSRNGLGKTTFVEIVHFCLGSTLRTDGTLKHEALLDWTFHLDLILRGKQFTVSRNTKDANYVWFDAENDWSDWVIQPEFDPKTNKAIMKLQKWRQLLGWLVFDFDPDENVKYGPSFRSMISYFVRLGREAFDNPFEHNRKQRTFDVQSNTAFLLGLGWEYAIRWQQLKDQENSLRQLRKISKTGDLTNVLGSIGELEATRVRLREQIAQQEQQLNTFHVHEQYRQIETRSDQLTESIHELSNENVHDARILTLYRDDLSQEQPSNLDRIVELYEEATVHLPQQIIRRLQEVEGFHRQISNNRKEFLKGEISRITDEVRQRNTVIQQYTSEKAELMLILRTHGALDEYTRLRERHSKLISELESVQFKIDNLKRLEQGLSELKIEREQLLIEARADHEERLQTRQEAISVFNANSESLYDLAGKLILDIDKNGFKFQVEIDRAPSEGIKQMGKVFTYDLTLAQLWCYKEVSPDFLIHDSAIFDGVDERQVAMALELAYQRSVEFDFQYICCINSDQIPYDLLDENFDFREYIRLYLTDSADDGGLLGIRF